MNTQEIRIADYNYPLPEARIAKYPLPNRSASKLLLRKSNGEIQEETFANIGQYLPAQSLVVFNNTKVIQARLHFQKNTGAQIEIFCLEPLAPQDYQQNFAATQGVVWSCLVGNAKKWKEGRLEKRIQVGSKQLLLTAERKGESGTGFEIRFAWDEDTITWSEILEAIGELPIPPYLNRATEASDMHNYQTVYSKIDGSVAAPTAGLHFTPEVLRELDEKSIERQELTLHVGAGTFKPVKSERIAEHAMHAEWIGVSRCLVERLLAHKAQCIAVGTTSVRTLESLYYLGVLIDEAQKRGERLDPDALHVAQWLPYDYAAAPGEKLSVEAALERILNYLDEVGQSTLHATTQIIIAPGYVFKIVRSIITNFHQPQSTLLLLVSAFLDGKWREVYDFALHKDFRFLSYGDSSFLNYDALEHKMLTD